MPEKTRGYGAIWPPKLAEPFEAFRRGTRTQSLHFLNSDCQREITGRPNVRATQCGKQIDVRGPSANAFERDKEFACSVVGKIVKVIEIEMPLDERFGEQSCVQRLLAAEADLFELRVGEF